MSEAIQRNCPECLISDPLALNRRGFLRDVSRQSAGIVTAGILSQSSLLRADAPPVAPRAAKPAEALIRELFQGMTDAQKQVAVYPWDHGAAANQAPTRQRFFNRAFGQTLGQVYTRPQQELLGRILRSMCSDDEGHRRIMTVLETDNWNNSGFAGAAASIFGNPAQGPFACVFTAHHLTIRCDGDSVPDAAFGGPMYHGHSVGGQSPRNVFNYQTRSVQSVFDALNPAQQRQAIVANSPGENAESVRFRPGPQAIPGLPSSELSADQRRLVDTVLRDLLSPYRREDADEVMAIVRRNGGLERIHLAYYRDPGVTDTNRWHFWRLEGPGFVWNFRVSPHVHCYVNIAVRA